MSVCAYLNNNYCDIYFFLFLLNQVTLDVFFILCTVRFGLFLSCRSFTLDTWISFCCTCSFVLVLRLIHSLFPSLLTLFHYYYWKQGNRLLLFFFILFHFIYILTFPLGFCLGAFEFCSLCPTELLCLCFSVYVCIFFFRRRPSMNKGSRGEQRGRHYQSIFYSK